MSYHVNFSAPTKPGFKSVFQKYRNMAPQNSPPDTTIEDDLKLRPKTQQETMAPQTPQELQKPKIEEPMLKEFQSQENPKTQEYKDKEWWLNYFFPKRNRDVDTTRRIDQAIVRDSLEKWSGTHITEFMQSHGYKWNPKTNKFESDAEKRLSKMTQSADKIRSPLGTNLRIRGSTHTKGAESDTERKINSLIDEMARQGLFWNESQSGWIRTASQAPNKYHVDFGWH